MYADFFGLREFPFSDTSDPRYYFATPDHDEALAALIYAVGQLKGFMMLAGESGTGKTMLTRHMLAHFGDRITFAQITVTPPRTCPSTNAPAHASLWFDVCREFDIDVPPPDGSAALDALLLERLREFLLEQFANCKPTLLLLDEAHNLSPETLEQVRLITERPADDVKLLQTILVGQPRLPQMLHQPKLAQLRQRLFRVINLPPLSREASGAYVRHRLAAASTADAHAQAEALFDASAIARIHDASHGIPRVINTVCDNALLMAYTRGVSTIDAAIVDEAAQALPPPGSTAATARDDDQPRLPDEMPAAGNIGAMPDPPGPTGAGQPAEDHRARHMAQQLATVQKSVERLADTLNKTQLAGAQQNAGHLNAVLKRVASLEQQLNEAARQSRQDAQKTEQQQAARANAAQRIARIEHDLIQSQATTGEWRDHAKRLADQLHHLERRIERQQWAYEQQQLDMQKRWQQATSRNTGTATPHARHANARLRSGLTLSRLEMQRENTHRLAQALKRVAARCRSLGQHDPAGATRTADAPCTNEPSASNATPSGTQAASLRDTATRTTAQAQTPTATGHPYSGTGTRPGRTNTPAFNLARQLQDLANRAERITRGTNAPADPPAPT